MKTINVTCPNGLVLNAVILRESESNNKVIILLQDIITVATKVENEWLLLDNTILYLANIDLD